MARATFRNYLHKIIKSLRQTKWNTFLKEIVRRRLCNIPITETFCKRNLCKYDVECAKVLLQDIAKRKRWNLRSRNFMILGTWKWQNFNCLVKGSGEWNWSNNLMYTIFSYQRSSFEGKSVENMPQIKKRKAIVFLQILL